MRDINFSFNQGTHVSKNQDSYEDNSSTISRRSSALWIDEEFQDPCSGTASVKKHEIVQDSFTLLDTNSLLDKMINYELQYGMSSSLFYKLYMGNHLQPDSDFNNWASIYKNIVLKTP